ncbi:NAD(P)H-dependent oxidoreductase [Dysgonomonas sp. Marseille-P4677]|uniref:NAD(P)H-dependent oxidoreductase n=1 Tax=Dysgonomonas sp. Marseille-P4677 TaxID=2364790 RepID=UPI00191244F3|nr:NAD(P)H-dependent oxidoreductase [Dysgonomonas sp. Marseille-P4677]MBK5722309.1 NAD(P)H-dependent oxidoreductase [Dysgonomonas sp. Marseille-P4677]
MVTILFAHPWHGSFNKAILDTVIKKLEKQDKEYKVIDLPKDNFNPMMQEADLKLYRVGKAADPLVEKYQKILKESDEVIFIFPIWWGLIPADIKGFFDKVFLVNFSHTYENGWTPLLTNIKRTLVFTTSESPTSKYNNFIEEIIFKGLLYPLGFQNGTWLNSEGTSRGSHDARVAFLQKVEETV